MNEIETSEKQPLAVEQIQQRLQAVVFGKGKHLYYLPTVDSTNTLALHMAREGAEEGVVVLTDNQTAGKGRQGRRWIDQPYAYAISSTILRPLFPLHLLIMLASLAVADTIAETCGLAATIKWPNDILIGTRKVAGILIETSHDHTSQLVAVLGIGVNVNGQMTQLGDHTFAASGTTQQELHSLTLAATTLETECGYPISREMFFVYLLQHLETNYLALQQEARDFNTDASNASSRLIRERWRRHLSTLGRTIEVRQNNTILSGVAEDVDENGELLLRSHSGERVSITWGDVWHLPDTQAH